MLTAQVFVLRCPQILVTVFRLAYMVTTIAMNVLRVTCLIITPVLLASRLIKTVLNVDTTQDSLIIVLLAL